MNKFYLEINIDNQKNASTKAVNDCNAILKTIGFLPIHLNIMKSGNKYIKKIKNALQFQLLMKIPKNSILVVPHPIYINKRYIEFIKRTKEKNNLKVIFLIHDIESLRKLFLDAQDDFEWLDKKMYKTADYIIAHNSNMKRYLMQQGVSKDKIFVLEIFDYLVSQNSFKENNKFVPILNIAGNLDPKKSKYLEKLNYLDELQFNLYGVNFNKEILFSNNIHYKGAFNPDEISTQLNQGFGLVWDGDEIECCSGNTGKYLQYNNPHKLSLYLVSELPVVIWSKAAETDFVLKNNLGIAIDTLKDLKEVFSNFSETEYQIMQTNVKRYSQMLLNGFFLKQVINEILKEIEMV